jgi:RHS repeat-associated protein
VLVLAVALATVLQTLVSTLGATPAAAGSSTGTWVQGTGANPPARSGASIAYNSALGTDVLFGGVTAGTLQNDTWAYASGAWSQRSPATSPLARQQAAMAYDVAHARVVLFGGQGLPGALSDTWVYDNATWVVQVTPPALTARYGASLVYDPVHQKVVLFGGYTGSTYLADTWVWDGTTWTNVTPAINPSARAFANLVYDAKSQHVELFGGETATGASNDTWTWNGTSWTQLTPSSAPPARWGATLAYALASGRSVLSGGTDGSATFSDTWTFDGATWSAESPSTLPAARSGAAAASQAYGAVLLFGGQSGAPFGDTWLWTTPPTPPRSVSAVGGAGSATVSWTSPYLSGGAAITQYTVVSSPDGVTTTTAGATTATVSGLRTGVAYTFTVTATNLVGTSAASAPSSPVTTLGGTGSSEWLHLTPSGSAPSARTSAAMVYVDTANSALLFGGLAGSTNQSDTWTWSGSAWTQRTPSSAPSARSAAALAYDKSAQRAVLFGGTTGTLPQNDLYTWDGTTWTRQLPALSPTPRSAAAMAYDDHDRDTVLFGGSGSSLLDNDTWLWSGTAWTQAVITSPPPARSNGSLAYDPATASLLLFGGSGSSGVLNDTWQWSGGTWTQLHPATTPPARSNATLVWDAAQQDLVLFGGVVNGADAADTWVWNGTTWTQIFPAASPAGRDGAVAVGWSTGGAFLFGGQNGGQLGDSWQFAVPPQSPSTVTASSGVNQATVSWTPPTITGGVPLTGYTVTSSPDGVTGTTGGSATSMTLSGLRPGVTYTFGVVAANQVGVSASVTSNPTTTPTVPGTPTAVSATAGSSQATVTWTAPSDGGSPITGYTVTPYIASSAQTPVSVGGSTTTAVVTGLTNGTAYTFTVTASNAVGAGPTATSNVVIPTTSTSAYAPTILSDSPTLYYRLDDSSGTVARDSSGNGRDATYQSGITLGVAGAVANDTDTAVQGSGSRSIAGFAAGTGLPTGNAPRTVEAWFKTTATGKQGLVTYGTQTNTQAFGLDILSPTQLFVFTWNNDVSFTAPSTITNNTWHDAVAVYDGAGHVTVYLDGAPLGTATLAGTTLNTVVSAQGLVMGSEMTGSVPFNGSLDEVAVYPTALSAARVLAHWQASGNGTPSAPGNVTATAGANSVTVAWQSSAANGATVTQYLITAYAGSQAENSVSVTGGSTSATVSGLAAGTAYTFSVYGINAYGSGASGLSRPATPTGMPTTYASTVLGDSPLLYWRFSETATSYSGAALTAADSSGHQYGGVFGCVNAANQSGALADDSDPSLNSCGGTGGGTHTTGLSGLPSGTSPRTVEAWFKTNNAYSGVIAGYSQNMMLKFPGNGGQYPYEIDLSGNTGASWIVPITHPVLDNNWHYVVAVYDGSRATLYLDAVSLGSQPYAPGASGSWFFAGAAPCRCGDSWSGNVDEVALYPAALTQAQVTAHFNASGNMTPGSVSNLSASSAAATQVSAAWTSATATVPTGATGVLGYTITAYQGPSVVGAITVAGNATTATIKGVPGGTATTLQVIPYNQFGAGMQSTSAAVIPAGSASTYSSTILADQPSLYWRMDEGTATYSGNMLFTADSSGHGSSGVFACVNSTGQAGALPNDTSASINACGGPGGAAHTINQTGLPTGSTPRSIEAWFKTNGAYGGIIAGYVGSMQVMFPGNGGQYPYEIDVTGPTNDAWIVPVTHPVLDNNWHQVVASFDGTNLTLYLDGQSLGAQPYTGASGTGGLTAGADGGHGANWTGGVDEIAVYSTALSAAQVLAHFAAGGNTRPTAVSDVVVTPGSNQVTVSWTPASATAPVGATALLGHFVTAYEGTTARGAVSVPGNATSATLMGLVPGVTYSVQVFAYNQFGTGPSVASSTFVVTGSPATYASTVQTDGPLLYWRVGEPTLAYAGNSMFAADSSGNGQVGVYTQTSGSCIAAVGQPGALANDPDSAGKSCGGPNGIARTVNLTGLPVGTAPRTVEAWFKTNNGYGSYVVGESGGMTIAFPGNGGQYPYEIDVLGASTDVWYVPTNHPVLDNNWHHAVASYDGATVTLYIDAQSYGAKPFTPGPGGSWFTAGAGPCPNGCSFTGGIDEAALYPTVLTAAQVTAHFNASGDTVPTAASGVTASGGAGQVVASWSAATASVPTGATGVLGYVVTASSGSTSVGSVVVPGNATTATIHGMTGGQSDTVQVYAYNQFGSGSTTTSNAATPGGPSPTYAGTVLGDSPSLYWRLSEPVASYGGSSLLAADASGHGNVGVYGCPTKMAQAGAFNDLDSAVFVDGACLDGAARTSPAAQLPSGPRTIEAWFSVQGEYAGAVVGYGPFIVRLGSANHGGDVQHDVWIDGVGDFYSPLADPLLSGQWHMVDLTYDGTRLSAYIDGLFIGSAPYSNAGTGPLRAGYIGCGCGDNYHGLVDDVAVYDHVLTGAQVANHFNNSSDAGPTPPESYGYFNPSEFLCNCFSTFYPVNDATGNFTHTFDDMSLPGRGPALHFTQTYNALNAGTPGALGYGWSHSYQMNLSFDSSDGNVTVNQENGSQVLFTNTGSGYVPPTRVLATLVKNGDATFTFTRRAREIFTFSTTGQLLQEGDLNGYTTTLGYSNGRLTSVTDPGGRALTFAYTNGQLTSVTDPTGRSVTFQYDGSGNLSALIDVGGGHTTFTYDTSHRMLTMTDPNSGVVTNTFDSSSRITSQTDPMGRKTLYAYGTNTTTVTDPKGSITVETYRSNKLVSVAKGSGTPQQATWQYTYDPVTLGVGTQTDPNGHSSSKTYDAAGNVLTTTDGSGRTTTNTYDALEDLLTSRDPLGITTTNTYDGAGNLLTTARPLTSTGQTATTSYAYGDVAHPGDLTAITDADGKTSHYAYDQYGDKTQATDALGDEQTTQYNTLGWVTSSVGPLGNVSGGTPANYTTSFARNAFGDVTTTTDALGHATTTQYDADRNVISVTDAESNVTQSAYNKDNELTLTTRADTTTIAYGYDAAGNRVSVTDGLGHTTHYAFDALNRLSSVTDPLNRTTSYTYDGAGNRVTMVDPQNQTTTYGYDAANEMTSTTYSDGTTPNVSNITYDADGQRTDFTDGTGTSHFVYDSLSRLTQWTTAAGQSVVYGYDLKGQVTSLQYPSGTVINRGYDDAGRLTSVARPIGRQSYTTTFGYDADGNVTSETYPNGVVATTGYDRTDRTTSIADTLGATSLVSFAYSRDNAGRLASVQPTGVSQGNETYGYDTLNRLTTVNQPTYAYDAGDNATTLGSATVTYDAANEATSLAQGGLTTTFSYDARGDRTQMAPQGSAATNLVYDQANRLISYGSTATYAYNADGMRMSSTVSGATTQFTWDASGSLPLLLEAGTVDYVYGPGGRAVAQIDVSVPGGAALYYHQDQLGSTRSLTDPSSNVVASFSYDAYGNLTGTTGSTLPNLLYAGQYRDTESGFYYLRARYYDPGTAQFLSRDPLVAETGQPYGYVSGNPLNATDPTGLCGLWGDDTCWGDAAGWASDHSHVIGQVFDGISTGAGLVAAAAAPIPFVGEVVTPIAGTVSIAAGGVGMIADTVAASTGHGEWSAVGLDALGLVTGGAAKFIRGAAEGLGLSRYAGNIVEGTLFGMKSVLFGFPGLLHDLFGVGGNSVASAAFLFGCQG